MTLALPQGGPALLAWAELLLTWAVASGYLDPGPSDADVRTRLRSGRAWTAALLQLLVAWAIVVPDGLAGVVVLLLPTSLWLVQRLLRAPAWDAHRLATECLPPIVLPILLALLLPHVRLRDGLVDLPWPHRQLAGACMHAAALVFLGQNGTHLVRAFLRHLGAVPRVPAPVAPVLTAKVASRHTMRLKWVPPDPAASVEQRPEDKEQLARGRVIGVLERWMAAVMVASGTYQALAFLMAAKGLIRSKDLERHEFAEYFLIGTLSSLGLAFAVGMVMQWITATFWTAH
jgi:hypothetical protein